jgi:HD-GYP domain-containing protein (c-di-GMP phosphodiesterase class II)
MARHWIQRWSSERRVSVAVRLLRGAEGSADLTRGRRAQLLSDLAAELEARDPYTHGHSRRVARHAVVIAMRMGVAERHVGTIRAAAALHDVGKINTPRAVLHKPGRLTDTELELIELHPVDGAEIVSTLGDPELTAMVRHHHERLDGTGYPDGLSGDEIPLGARIIAVADTFDAITSTRPYRPPRNHPAGVRALQAYYAESPMRPLWTPPRRSPLAPPPFTPAPRSRRALG